jgi:hypothetical protein
MVLTPDSVDLAAEGWLRRMQPPFRREVHAPRLSDGDEIAKMSQLHTETYTAQAYRINLQSPFHPRRKALVIRANGESRACRRAEQALSFGELVA